MPPLPTTGWWPTQQEIFTVRPSMADLTMTALFTSSLRKRSLPLSGDPFPQRKGCWFIVEPGSPVFQLLIYVLLRFQFLDKPIHIAFLVVRRLIKCQFHLFCGVIELAL